MLSKLREIIWPVLDLGTDEDRARKEEQHTNDLAAILRTRWKNQGVILEEARRLVLREDERRKTAETKATIYLAVLAAIVPLSLSFVKDLSAYFSTLSHWQIIVLLGLLLVAIAYLFRAGIWIFRTIQVSIHDRVDVKELVELRSASDTELELCRKILTSVMRNNKYGNQKFTKLRMAHAFLLRTFIAFILIIVYVGAITVYNYFDKYCRHVQDLVGFVY